MELNSSLEIDRDNRRDPSLARPARACRRALRKSRRSPRTPIGIMVATGRSAAGASLRTLERPQPIVLA